MTAFRRARHKGMGVMLRTVYAIVAAAIVSAAFLAFLSLSMNLEANAHVPGRYAATCSELLAACLAIFRSLLSSRFKQALRANPRCALDFDRPIHASGRQLTPAGLSTFHTGRNCAKSRAGSAGSNDRPDRQLRQLYLQPGSLFW